MAASGFQLVDDSLVALSESAAARLLGVSRRQLTYWAETRLVRPSIAADFGPRSRPRLYAFDEVLALLVVCQMRRQFSLQHIRRVVVHLGSHGYDRPLTEVRFAVDGRQIYFQHADGTWEGDRRPGQVVLSHVLALDPLRQQIRHATLTARTKQLRGNVERRRSVVGSKPVFAGTRTPVEALYSYLRRGYSTAQILDEFPHLSTHDIKTARKSFRESGAA